MTLLFLAGIYFFARGVFALYGQTIFYTKRVLENIEEKNIPAYLKEIGKMNLLLGVLFVGKACLDIPFPGSRPILYGWLLILLLCVFSKHFPFPKSIQNIKSNKHKSSLCTCTERIFLYKKRRYLSKHRLFST